MILLYSPFASTSDAEKAAESLLKSTLIACANILPPSTSLYEWDGGRVSETEVILLCKTTHELGEQAAKELEKLHPYDCPCILRIHAEGNKEYERWVRESVDRNS